MKIEKCEVFRDRFCNECGSTNDVKEVTLGNWISALCKDCRVKVKDMLVADLGELNFKEYQEKALRTKGIYTDNIDQLLNGVMGLNGEAGEVIDIVKKYLYQGHELDINKIIDECGDVLWYLNLVADAIGTNLEYIAKYNIKKLEKRYPEGYFKTEDSVNRVEDKDVL